MPPRQDSKTNGLAWANADHSVDQYKAFALLNGWPYGGTSKAAIKASLVARVNALGAGDQVWIPPDPAAPAPGPAPAPAPAHAPTPAPAPTIPSPPTNLAAAMMPGVRRIRLTWTPATADEVHVHKSETGSFRDVATVYGPSIWVDTNVRVGHTYEYFVTHENQAGVSQQSNIVTETVPKAPAPPPTGQQRQSKSWLDRLDESMDNLDKDVADWLNKN